jgi:Rab guanine nucleotide exchange factor SEC2
MSSANLLQESASAQLSNPGANICCALCGMPIFSIDGGSSPSNPRPPSHPLSRTSSSINTLSRSANLLFKKPLSYSATNSANSSPPASPRRSSYGSPPPQQQVYIFRLASTGSSTANLGVAMLPASIAASYSAPSTSMSSQSPQHPSRTSTQQQTRNSQSTIYPLCTSGWCLTRLRSTCSLWAFVRTGVIEKVWEEEVSVLPASVPFKSAISGPNSVGLGKPPIPPRRRGLWGMASAFGERAASWGSETDKDKGRPLFTPSTPDKEVERKLPPPPPAHPASPSASSKKPVMSSPPPLPKRAEGRGRTRSATISRSATASPTPKTTVPVVEEDLTPIVNGHLPPDDAGHTTAEQSEKADESTPTESSSSTTDESKAEATTQPLLADKEPSNSNHKAPDSNLTSPLPSPTTDRRTSQDSFASAASEITPSEATPPPDSAHEIFQEVVIPPPGSSKIQSSNPPPTPTQANTITESVSPSTPALHNDITKNVSSQTAPAVPPPLPRRAEHVLGFHP